MTKKTLSSQHATSACSDFGYAGILKNVLPFPVGVTNSIFNHLRHLAAAGRWCASLVFVMMMSAVSNKMEGQNDCNYTCASSSYKCVIASSDFYFPTSINELIGPGMHQFLPMSGGAATTPQHVIVKGWVKFDSSYTFATGSDIVFEQTNNGFIVTGGATLTIDSSNTSQITSLRGCNIMWKGIFVRANSKLVLKDSTEISDALNAVSLSHNSTLISTGARYLQNYICIAAEPIDGDPPMINVNTSIIGSKFDGSASELFPFNSNSLGKPQHAIIANYVKQFSIGATGANVAKNVFKGFMAPPGIDGRALPAVASFNTNMTVRNSSFEDIGDIPTVPNIGVWSASDNTGIFTLDLKGLGKTGSPSFYKVSTGIQCLGTNLILDSCKFENGIDHIRIEASNNPIGPNGSGALSYNIGNSTFENFSSRAIFAENVFPAQRFNVNDNVFEDSNGASLISVGQFISKSPSASFLRITDNLINKSSDVGSTGFELRGISDAYIADNTFSNTSSFGSFELLLNSSNNTIIKNNTFEGVNDATDQSEYGLFVRNSSRTKALCNTFDQLGIGMFFEGNHCDGSIIYDNTFGNHAISGLYLPDFTTIGKQPANANTWPVNSSTDEARFELDPFDLTYFTKLSASKFIVADPETTNAPLWPQTRYPSGNAWFSYLDIEQDELCTIYGGVSPGDDTGLTATDGMVVDDTHPDYGGFKATKWDAQFRLYGKLYTHPDLHPTGTAIDTFYDVNQDEPFAKLAVAFEQYNQATTLDSILNNELEDYYSEMRSLTKKIVRTDSLVVLTSIGSLASLWETRNGYVNELDSINQLAISALDSFIVDRNSILSTLEETVNSIITSETWEANLQSAFSILLAGSQTVPAWEWTSTQRGTLRDIATQCAHEGGYGVILSRLMLEDNSLNDDYCFGERIASNTSQAAADYGMQIYPNPTAGVLHILEAGEGQLLVRDQSGRTVLEQKANGKMLVVDMSRLSNGMYFLQIVNGTQLSGVHKVFLNKQ